jgi:hypothetical protein
MTMALLKGMLFYLSGGTIFCAFFVLGMSGGTGLQPCPMPATG